MRLGHEYTGSEMLEIVKQRGYFEIRLIPNFVSQLSFTALEEIVRKNQVKHRGTYYPHIADHKFGKIQRVDNNIESFHHWGQTAEIWRFYKSGQFKHFRGFMEDRWDSHPPFGAQWDPAMENPIPENTFFEPIVKIWEMTEMFLFASKLADELKCELTIEIKLHKMDNRKLQIRTGDRFDFGLNYTCHTNTISLESLSVPAEELQINHDELAGEKMLEIFDYFGWNASHIPSIIKQEQKKFYSHSF